MNVCTFWPVMSREKGSVKRKCSFTIYAFSAILKVWLTSILNLRLALMETIKQLTEHVISFYMLSWWNYWTCMVSLTVCWFVMLNLRASNRKVQHHRPEQELTNRPARPVCCYVIVMLLQEFLRHSSLPTTYPLSCSSTSLIILHHNLARNSESYIPLVVSLRSMRAYLTEFAVPTWRGLHLKSAHWILNIRLKTVIYRDCFLLI